MKNYLLYSIGEILLVMIGILLALQVNNWNERRKDRILEKEILIEIKNTLEVNSQLVENQIAVIENLNKTSDKVIAIIENDSIYSSTYEQDFYYSFYSGTNIYLSNNGYEALKNAGFEIISNNSVKNSIVNLFSVKNVKTAQFINYIKENFKLYESFLIQYFITEEHRLVPINFLQLREDAQFLAIIKRMKERRLRVLSNLQSFSSENQKMLQLINDELGEPDS